MKEVNARRNVFKRYEEAFGSMKGIHFQPEFKNTYSNRWLTALTIDPEETGVTRTEIIEKLEESNIEARPVWKPMHLQPLFEQFDYYSHEENNSVSEELFEHRLCLPSGSNMTDILQSIVIKLIENMLN